MPKIQRLSEETINRIAAGEVIENPASVIKELIENAIDAGARHIIVETKGGGFGLIRVIDDGCGMSSEDAMLAFERHATSKIISSDDLFSLSTMGFRGEALASIASIAEVTLITAEDSTGTKIEVVGGKILSAEPFPRKQGTTVEVRSLFFNVPARKKFQKSPAASNAEIYKLLVTLSLAYPSIGLQLQSEDRMAFSAPALAGSFFEQLEHRLVATLGDSVASQARMIDRDGIQGFLGASLHSRPKRSGQYVFVNSRAVSSPLISYAVRAAYGTRLDEDRHPIFALHLQMPPEMVDVNVHPQKKEVRFQEEAALKEKILRAVAETLDPAPSFSAPLVFMEASPERMSYPLVFQETKQQPQLFEEWHAVGVWKQFLFVEGREEGLWIVDLCAAQEKIALRQLTKDQDAPSQGLLLSERVELTAEETKELELRKDALTKMGFSLQLIGRTTFLVDATPPFIPMDQIAEVLKELAGGGDLPKKIARFARRKKQFMIQEALALWKEVADDPQDAAVAVRRAPEELAQLFKKAPTSSAAPR
ncbi:MAG: DNA mismatch repair endonuclease MutL [Verrucomicrobia bacterium]|nr:DNA mismatch repair endonuclease MutL [Verrucomicrobiota bacterium]